MLRLIGLVFVLICVVTSAEVDSRTAEYFENINSVKPLYAHYHNDVSKILKILTNEGALAGRAWDWLANLTDTFGNRVVGSDRLENAIDYLVDYTKQQGFDNVHKEPVPNLTNWIRGEEEAWLLEPRKLKLNILATGGSIAGDVTADVIVVQSFDELKEVGSKGLVKGKIVVYNEPWKSYGESVAYRSGAVQAAEQGAVGVLIRSVTSFSIYSPHTGSSSYKDGVKQIPSACVTVEEAEMMWRMQQRGDKLRVNMKLSAHTNGTITSHNTVSVTFHTSLYCV